MDTSFKYQTAIPFLKTDLILYSWREQLKQGINFTFKDGSVFLIRQMCKRDVNRVFQLEQGIFTDPWPITAFHDGSQNKRNYLNIVGIIDSNIVAYAMSQFVLDELHIHNVAVDPQNRRKGYGKTLLWLTLEIALHEGIKVCYLEVRRSNLAALSLYRKFGFKIVGIRKRYYIKQNEDALLLTLLI